MDISFCSDKLNLLYTDYREQEKTFLRATLTEIEATVMSLPKREWETIRLLERAQHENANFAAQNNGLTQQIGRIDQQNTELAEQKGEMAKRNDALAQHNNTLTQLNTLLTQQNNAFAQQHNESAQQVSALTQQISDIYNSRTWKIGKKLQRAYRLFIPQKKFNSGGE